MSLLLHLVRGFLVGIAGLLPGLCGSTLLVLFGIYRPLTAALARPFEHFRAKVLHFGPFYLAAGAGMLVGSRVLAALFDQYEIPLIYLFMGFMTGGLPELFRQARRTPGSLAGRLAFVILFGACLALAFWQTRLVPHGTAPHIHWGIWILAGAGVGLGSIMPGVSVAFLLIHFGIYPPMLRGVATLQPDVLIPAAIGAAAVILSLARTADWLFRTAEGPTVRGILGLVVGSIVLVYPGWPGGRQGLIGIGLFLLGGGASLGLNQLAPPPHPA